MYEFDVAKELGASMLTDTSKKWEELRVKIEDLLEKEDEIKIKFDSVTLQRAHENDDFREMVTNEKIYMSFYGSDELVGICDEMCKLDLKKPGRFVSYTPRMEAEKTKDDMARERVYKMLQSNWDKISFKDGEYIVIKIHEIITQLENSNTANALLDVVKNRAKSGDKVAIVLGNLGVSDSVKAIIANGISELKEAGIKLTVKSSGDAEGIINTLSTVGKNNMTAREKFNGFLEYYKVGYVGILSKFARQGGNNMMTRLKTAKPIMARVAIFRGSEPDGHLIFETYNKDTFFRREDYRYENEGEEPPELKSEMIKVHISELGYSNKCVGMVWHFNEPVQLTGTKKHYIYDWDENCKIRRKHLFLPEYINQVLSDHRVDFDMPELLKAIQITRNNFSE